jgi:capsular exopolysaccharide synthesis family protein
MQESSSTGPLAIAGPVGLNGSSPAVLANGSSRLVPHQMLPPAGLSSTPNAISLLKALRRRWLLASLLGIVAAAVTAAAVWVFLPPGNHTAYIRLNMPMKRETVLFPSAESGNEFLSFQRTQMTLLKSRLVLNATLKDPRVAKLDWLATTDSINTVEWLEKEIKVDLTDGPELPRVTMTGENPDQLKILVSAVVDAYLAEVVGKQAARRQARLDLLQEISDRYKQRLKRIQDARSALANAIGADKEAVIALKQQLAEQQLALARQEFLKVEAELRRIRLEAKTLELKQDTNVQIPGELVDATIEKELQALLDERSKLEARLKTAFEAVPDDTNPTIKKYRAEIHAKNLVIEEQRKKLRPDVTARLLKLTQGDTKGRLALTREQIAFNEEFRDVLAQEIERLEGGQKNLTKNALDLDSSQNDLDLAKAGVARVAAEIDKETVEAPAPPRVSRLEPDVVVVSPNETIRKMKAAGIGAGAALAVVLLLVALLEFRAGRLDSADEVVRGLGLNLVGSLPAAPRRFGRRLISNGGAGTADWQSMLAESVDSARTLLLRAASAKGLRVVMITSASSGEGKTSLATHLAASLARAGHKTLLIDGDLRRSAAHRIFDLPLVPGLSEFLRGEVDLAHVVQPTQANGLWLLPAGACDGGAIQLLAGGAIQGLLGRLKQDYDFIVLDSSPVLAVADSLILAQHVDGILLALLHEVSRLPKVYAACQRLGMLHAPMLGVVINGTRDDEHGYGPYYAAATNA